MAVMQGRIADAARRAGMVLVLVTAAALVRAQQQPPAGQPASSPQQPPQQQVPVFRGGVKLVRVDVTVTGKGDRPVADLTPADFEVTEDGVPQKVDQLQFTRLDGQRPAGDETSLEIRSPDQAEAEAARDDVRVFAIFLDDYHVDKAPQITLPLRRALTLFLERLWPTDVVAMMDPLTPLSALRFTRAKAEMERIVNTFEGRQGEIFPVKSVMEEAQLRRSDITRVRAQVTLSALAALTVKLGGIKEGRKAIIFVSQGPPTFFGSREPDLQDQMREIVQAANRGNVTIYPLDPVGLTMERRRGDMNTLYQLAAETGGRPIVNTNNFDVGLGRVMEDSSAYYVLGYTPTRTEDDGKFHKISVKVKRPGTRVLARQGYFAPSNRELMAAAEASARVVEPQVAGALRTLATQEPGKRPADVWVGLSKGPEARTKVVVTWDPIEPAPQAAVASVDVEVLPASTVPAMPLQALSAPTAAKPARTAAVFEFEPGPFTLRFTARAGDRSEVDRWMSTLTAPDWNRETIMMSTPRFYRARSLPEWRAIQSSPDPVPTAVRQFGRGDRVLVAVECYSATSGFTAELSAHVLTREGQELTALPVPALEQGSARFELPVGSLGQGTYILRLRAAVGPERAEQLTAIRITR
jgi:VWFA-related protein